jgi:hypothetical protein
LPLIFPSLHPPLGIRNEKTNKRIGSWVFRGRISHP